MSGVGNVLKVTLSLLLIISLAISSGGLTLALYAKITGKPWAFSAAFVAADDNHRQDDQNAGDEESTEDGEAAPEPYPSSAMLTAPAIRQYPELYSGCEVTSLAMLLQFAGFDKDKMELAEEMPKDPTPIRYNEDGSIAYWGNPNLGFVGEVTGKAKGFGIFHTALIKQLESYIPSAVDLTGGEFEDIERHIAGGIPVIAWTTITFRIPDKWVVWDTPIGPIKTTFIEHAVLVVGYDENYVYVNDPYSGKAQVKVDKARFIETWELMGKQAITYTN
ncbi:MULTISPECIES: C39 family peptidase [unclassified Paenibacillus]|uniref:C39 family peptidase n=1 Tax=unclassified Paenibacillus TaxID=185978 RepID=UPI0011A9FE6E|nr:C39 family peptidase [Paenibacillus sp. 32O-W]